MPRFDASKFMTLTSDGGELDVHEASFRDVRFNVPAAKVITIDASTEADLPGIAASHLGDINLWWVLLDFNGLIDPIEDIFPGQVLRIPERSSLISYLDRLEALEQSVSDVVVI